MADFGELGLSGSVPGDAPLITDYDISYPQELTNLQYDGGYGFWWKFVPNQDGYIGFESSTINPDVEATLMSIEVEGTDAWASYVPNDSWTGTAIIVQVTAGDPIHLFITSYDDSGLGYSFIRLKASSYWTTGLGAIVSEEESVELAFDHDGPFTEESAGNLSPPGKMTIDAEVRRRLVQANNGYLSEPDLGALTLAAIEYMSEHDELLPEPYEFIGFTPDPPNATTNGGDYPPGNYPSGSTSFNPWLNTSVNSTVMLKVYTKDAQTLAEGDPGGPAWDGPHWDPDLGNDPVEDDAYYPWYTEAIAQSVAISYSATDMVSRGEVSLGVDTVATVAMGEPGFTSVSAGIDHPDTNFPEGDSVDGVVRLFVRMAASDDGDSGVLTNSTQRGVDLGTFDYASEPTWRPFSLDLLQACYDAEGGSTDAKRLQFLVEPEEYFTAPSSSATRYVSFTTATWVTVLLEVLLPAYRTRLVNFPPSDYVVGELEGDIEGVRARFT